VIAEGEERTPEIEHGFPYVIPLSGTFFPVTVIPADAEEPAFPTVKSDSATTISS